jgi:hypothetical protein
MDHPQQTFLREIEAFLSKSGMSASRFGKEALGDPSFINDLRNGRMPNLRLVHRVNGFIAAQQQVAA